MGARASRKYAIVFAGGGAKGAYQIGVWKYLRERRLAWWITGVSGASIGAINSLLFAQGDYQAAEAMWMQARQGDIMAPKAKEHKGVKTEAEAFLGGIALGHQLGGVVAMPMVLGGMATALGTPALVGMAAKLSSGLFSQDRLENMIQECIDQDRLTTSIQERIEVYTVLTKLTRPHLPHQAKGMDPAFSQASFITEAEYRPWRGLDYEKIVETVLASAAFPLAYPPTVMETGIYTDGGVLDNAPVTPVIEAGFQNIIVVHLQSLKQKARRAKEAALEAGRKGVTFHHVWPSESIGKTFEISAELTQRRIELGYRDAKEQIFCRQT